MLRDLHDVAFAAAAPAMPSLVTEFGPDEPLLALSFDGRELTAATPRRVLAAHEAGTRQVQTGSDPFRTPGVQAGSDPSVPRGYRRGQTPSVPRGYRWGQTPLGWR